MSLSPQERDILALLRTRPSLDASGLAQALGTTKGAVAVALSRLTAKGEIVGRGYVLRDRPTAVVFGGANWDIKARSLNAAIPGTSNPAVISRTPGGVGRNIAENLARLGHRVELVAAVGADEAGTQLVARMVEAGIDTASLVTSPHPTGTYLAALDADGELVIGLSDMAGTDTLTVADIARSRDLLARAQAVVVDGNLPADVIEWVLEEARAAGVRVVLDPVSVAKAGRLSPALHPGRPVFAVKPTVDELSALTGNDVADTTGAIVAAAETLLARGVANVWVSRGSRGSLLVGADGVLEAPTAAARVEDVTGAGDAMTAGFVHGLLGGQSLADCVRFGHTAAALTIASTHTVRVDLGVAFARATADASATTSQQQGVTP
jgi:pseudouridine kinase